MILSCLKLINLRYGLRVSGAIQGKELHSSLPFGVVANENRSFWSSSTKGRQLYFTWVLDFCFIPVYFQSILILSLSLSLSLSVMSFKITPKSPTDSNIGSIWTTNLSLNIFRLYLTIILSQFIFWNMLS